MRLHSVAVRRSVMLALAVVIAACATTSSPQEEVVITQPAAVVTTEPAVVTIPTDIATIHPGLVTAWRGTDPAAFRVFFGDDAVVVTPMRTYTGWEEINTAYLTPMLPTLSNYTLTPATFTTEGTDIIVETGSLAYRVTKDGKVEDISGTYTHRWRKQADGTWRLVSVDVK